MKSVEITLPLSVVAANNLASASAWDCSIPIVICHASVYKICELMIQLCLAQPAQYCQRTDFWNFSRYRCAACFCSLCPSRMVDIAVKTGAKAPSGPLPFVAMSTSCDGGAECGVSLVERSGKACISGRPEKNVWV
jgi:hypothetical protein